VWTVVDDVLRTLVRWTRQEKRAVD